jgi:hypothetical protein
MSADTTPISSSRFAAALKDLSVEMLRLKVLEIRNSIAHLQYSNDQLKPFAEGTAIAASTSNSTATTTIAANNNEPDQDCIDAIRENEAVIDRMAERIALIRLEVEERGVSWNEFQSKEEVEAQQQQRESEQNGDGEEESSRVNGNGVGHSPWTDGTFQTGTIRNGEVHFDAPQGQTQGGSLSDEQLRRALEERMRELNHDDGLEDEDGGMHL